MRDANQVRLLVLTDHIKQKDIEAFTKYLLENYQKDTRLATWMGDHLFGKAPQPLVGDKDNPIAVAISGMQIVLDKTPS